MYSILVYVELCHFNAFCFFLIVDGTYDSALATRYCMTIKDIDGNFIRIGERNIDTNQEM